jgi:hypothetical protein
MLFSIPVSGWVLIAIAATVFFTVGMRVFFGAMKPPAGACLADELRNTLERQTRKSIQLLYAVAPVGAAAILVSRLLTEPEPAAEILFLYSVAFVAIPVALFPIRGRLRDNYLAQQMKPGTEIKPDRFSLVWTCGFLITVGIAAAVVLSTAQHSI